MRSFSPPAHIRHVPTRAPDKIRTCDLCRRSLRLPPSPHGHCCQRALSLSRRIARP
jgi:hypothetical protein